MDFLEGKRQEYLRKQGSRNIFEPRERREEEEEITEIVIIYCSVKSKG